MTAIKSLMIIIDRILATVLQSNVLSVQQVAVVIMIRNLWTSLQVYSLLLKSLITICLFKIVKMVSPNLSHGDHNQLCLTSSLKS